jgi:hypothetical protein
MESTQLFLKEKLPKRTLGRGIAFRTKALPLLAFLFFRRFFSLAQREKAALILIESGSMA